MGADAETLAQARQSVLQGFLQSARAARSGGDFESARTFANIGLDHQPDDTMAEFLRQELADIDAAESNARRAQSAAEQQRFAAERAREIATLEQQFETAVAATEFSIEDGRRLANTVERLRGLGATGDVVDSGRVRIAAALQRQAEVARNAGDWDTARSIAAGARNLLPEVAAARTFAANLENEFSQYERARADQDRAETLAQYQSLMAQATVDRAWLTNVWQVRALLSDDTAFMQTSSQDIAAKLAEQVVSLASADRFSAARQLLDRGFEVLPDNGRLIEANTNLQRAEATFAERSAEREQAAQLAARVQTVRDRASANNIDGAKSALDALRSELPADHPIFSEAPILFADAYIRLAESDVRAGQFERANERVSLGQKLAPNYGALQDMLDQIRAAQQSDQQQQEERASRERMARLQRERADNLANAISSALERPGTLDVESVRRDLSDLQDLSAGDYARREGLLASASVAFLDELTNTDYQAARARLDALRSIFPQHSPITAYVLPEPPRPTEDFCANDSFAGMGADSRAICRDYLTADRQGPRLVVLPAGGPSPAPFAITKYEITISEYNVYCEMSGACSSLPGNAAMPVTNVSLSDAQAYARWLTATTGFEYRLPTAAEWEYAATAPGTTPPPKNVNCEIRSGGQLMKGISLEDVRTGESNGWGLQNYVGNAREWVVDSGRTLARGGSYKDSFDSCDISLQVPHSGQPDAVTSFRLVRKVGGSSG